MALLKGLFRHSRAMKAGYKDGQSTVIQISMQPLNSSFNVTPSELFLQRKFILALISYSQVQKLLLHLNMPIRICIMMCAPDSENFHQVNLWWLQIFTHRLNGFQEDLRYRPVLYKVKLQDGSIIRRHIDHICAYYPEPELHATPREVHLQNSSLLTVP